jgi:hypothetical protein
MKILSLVSFAFFGLISYAAQGIAATTPPAGAVLTWHNDNFRTGWQQQETILTTSTASKLGISHSVTLKDQVDAQPLVVPRSILGLRSRSRLIAGIMDPVSELIPLR